MKNSLQPFVEKSKEIDKKFNRQWGLETRLINLSEEIGELSRSILVSQGKKKDNGHEFTISDNLSNVLYEIFLIADATKVNLDEAWDEFLRIIPGITKDRNSKD